MAGLHHHQIFKIAYKIFHWSKLKAFAVSNKLYTDKMVTVVCDKTETIMLKGENAGYPHFLLFQTFFSEGFFDRIEIVCKNVKTMKF